MDVALVWDLDEYAETHRAPAPELAIAKRRSSFTEVELGFDERTAREEAKRCLRCDLDWLDFKHLPRPVADQAAAPASAAPAKKGGR